MFCKVFCIVLGSLTVNIFHYCSGFCVHFERALTLWNTKIRIIGKDRKWKDIQWKTLKPESLRIEWLRDVCGNKLNESS